ncbi:MAG: DUF3050 domain-containing protein [Planctomycetaceae bacterium]
MSDWNEMLDRLRPLRDTLLSHPVYQRIDSPAAVRTFMQAHVYAVWDFMSLLKTLQRRLTCVSLPWVPPEHPAVARLVNEIVLAEETDQLEDGTIISHFNLYLEAMREAGADTRPVEGFLARLVARPNIDAAMTASELPAAEQAFLRETFRVIETDSLPAIAAAFTVGRENLLPELFQQVVNRLDASTGTDFTTFRLYLDRHIALDGDEHGPAAQRLVETLCGDDDRNWRNAESAARAALESRLQLWDAVSERIGRA